MTELVICWLCLCSVTFLMAANGQSYTEQYRLQVHFSTPSGWSNDPNGLIYNDGFYHLYYQHNPNDTKFGPMHWGHAQSRDLIHWENLPIAMKPYEKGVIFSGCCILDKDNVTGVAPSSADEEVTNVPTIAIYTLHSDANIQSQAMAFSLDKGLTWTQYAANPIIPNPDTPDFRDPNIFARNELFYMVLAVNDRIKFFSSADLLAWNELSDFGVLPDEGDKSGVWECPSLITLMDEQGTEHDLLIISANGDSRSGLMQYFIGKFNGTAFNSYDKTKVLRADNGFDNYAAIPYQNDPHGRVILIGWLSNWLYAQEIPTSIWRGQMTIPREVALQTIDGNIHLVQRPVDAFYTIIDSSRIWSLATPLEISGQQIVDLTSQIPFKTGSMLSLKYAIDVQNAANGKIGLQFTNNRDEFVSFDYYVDEHIYELDRSHSGNVSFSPKFADQSARANRISNSNQLTGHIILDTASIEIFADDGLNTFSALFFPTDPLENVQLVFALEDDDSAKSVIVEKLDVAALNSIWAH